MTRLRSCLYVKACLILLTLPSLVFAFDCNVTKPEAWPNSNGPMGNGPTHAWYGSDLLAALIPKSGVWTGMGKSRSYGDKFWWWRKGYSAWAEATPDLKIKALRLDGPHQEFVIDKATNASGVNGDWDAMLVGMHFPSEGCWELRGLYNGREELVIVVQVQDPAKDREQDPAHR